MPYSADRLAAAPPVCHFMRHLFRARVPVIHYNVVEWHRPERVLRQFGMAQHIPVISQEERAQQACLHKITRKGQRSDRRWVTKHGVHIQEWMRAGERIQEEAAQPIAWATYLQWYDSITRRIVLRPRPDQINQRGRPEDQPVAPFVPHGSQVVSVVSNFVSYHAYLH